MQFGDRCLQLLILLPLPLAYLAVGALVRVSIGAHWTITGGLLISEKQQNQGRFPAPGSPKSPPFALATLLQKLSMSPLSRDQQRTVTAACVRVDPSVKLGA
jgi:hypothetical protein